MKQLSILDSLFLYAENSKSPMHIGSLFVLAPTEENKKFNFAEFKQFYNDRIHLVPVYRQRLVETPLNLGRPYWINDPDFKIDNHLFHIALPDDGTRQDLVNLSAQLYNTMLDRSRPLWTLTVISGLNHVEGFPPNSVVLLSKIHHACIDGVSGAEILGAMFDVSPIPRTVEPPSEIWQAEEIKSMTRLVATDYAKQVLKVPSKLVDFVKTSGQSLQTIMSTDVKFKDLYDQFLNFNAPSTLFNQSVSASKSLGFANLSFDRVKKVKKQADVKVNDVMLAICSAGIRKYLLKKGELPEKSLVAAAPVSLRKKEQKGTMGNQVTMMGVELATNEANPLERLKKINAKTKNSKVIAKAAPVNSIMEFVPSEVAAAAAQLYTKMSFLSRYALLYNVVITNVPGPPVPIYLNGFKVIRHFGLGITMENMGLMIAIFSTDQDISVSLTACEDLIPDAQQLADYIKEALDELENSLDAIEEEVTFFNDLADKHNISEEQKVSLLVKEVNSLKADLAAAKKTKTPRKPRTNKA